MSEKKSVDEAPSSEEGEQGSSSEVLGVSKHIPTSQAKESGCVQEDVGKEAVRRCENVVRGMRAGSPRDIYTSPNKDVMGLFQFEELDLGRLLGSGEFSSVYEVKSFQLSEGIEYTGKEEKARKFLAEHAVREETDDARYAIKHLRKALLSDPDTFLIGAQDLALEAQLLQCLQHPHIIKIRGLASAGWNGYASGRNVGYFLILDRLNGTLEDRLKLWSRKQRKYQRFVRVLDVHRKKRESLLETRLKVSFDIAGALDHLHTRSIVFRDLKPQNLGFDVRGDIKVFDLGLAKELPIYDEGKDERFELSGAGSRRYMAPEMVLQKPYNLKSDVYSFSILLWQILALKVPFENYSSKLHMDGVIIDGERPEIDSKWPRTIQNMLSIGWSPDPAVRPTMSKFYGALRREVAAVNGGSDDDLEREHRRRRSTYVMPRFNSSSSVSKVGS